MGTFRAAIHVRPGARADLVGGSSPAVRDGDLPVLRVQVRARPVEGAATAAAERAVADALGVRNRQVRVVSGATSRDKVVEVADPPDDIRARWQALLADER